MGQIKCIQHQFFSLSATSYIYCCCITGVYADEIGLKEKLSSESKYTELAVSDLKQNKAFYDDLTTSDFKMGVRLVIVYGRLKIGSVRSAFEDSIGSRIKKFNGKEDRPLLERLGKENKYDNL